jgi:four helix bundle protein
LAASRPKIEQEIGESSEESRKTNARYPAVSFLLSTFFSLPSASLSTGLRIPRRPIKSPALSIATNLAEGNGRFTKPDRRNFFTIARGLAQECVPLLEIARRRVLINDTAAIALKERLEIISIMISGLDERDE